MNFEKYKALLLGAIFVLLAGSSASAVLTESDKQLNKNIRTFTPVYCGVKRIPWEYWGRRYEFEISLVDDEKATPRPMSDLSNEFLGYKNKKTELQLICNKLDSSFDRLVSSKVIEIFEIDDFSKKLVYLINDIGPQKKVEITISVERDMRNIEVVESRSNLKIFKKYKAARIFDVDFLVKEASELNTISAYSKDSIVYNLK